MRWLFLRFMVRTIQIQKGSYLPPSTVATRTLFDLSWRKWESTIGSQNLPFGEQKLPNLTTKKPISVMYRPKYVLVSCVSYSSSSKYLESFIHIKYSFYHKIQRCQPLSMFIYPVICSDQCSDCQNWCGKMAVKGPLFDYPDTLLTFPIPVIERNEKGV